MDDVGKLIRFTGARAPIDADRFDKASARVAAHWENVVEEQRRSRTARFSRLAAMAASVVLAVAIGFLMWRDAPVPPQLYAATVDRVVGDVRVDGRTLAAGDTIPADVFIATVGDSRVALRLADGQSLRLDQKSGLEILADVRFRLDSGSVYVDSGLDPDAQAVFVDTPYGVVTDVGTQFLVRLKTNTVEVGVREGLAELARPGRDVLTVNRGYVLEVAAGGGEDRREIEDDDTMWDWVNTVAPEIETNGTTLASYLGWYAREKGYEIEWADDGSQENAMSTTLSVSISGLSLSEGFALVQAVAPFEYEIDESTMRVTVGR